MSIKIEGRITEYEVVTEGPDAGAAAPPAAGGSNIIQMHEKVERPEALFGSTYKVKTPLSEHALYVTINDIILNPGTEYELRRPFEIFINSKNMDHFQWIVALTRIISAVFRKGGDVTFLVEEMHSVFDPRGGYFKKGGVFMPSLVAEIGDVIERHLRMIGLIKDDGLDEHQQRFVEEKRAEYEASRRDGSGGESEEGGTEAAAFPESARLCGKCRTKAVILMDGCLTCLNCGDSKCG
ncbi:ribonucleotide-diphosphate reductase subunit alpha [bacterium BMS3Bbin12]|nr:ribonucleotide-diphosphate reductase subunit alpha [bacterium BMS3Abin12]GBE48206.1 ribonucleotide-diphosphate reductase subunit alpha [bacterium BMS3Bbin12]GBE50444.1 ribonucleotide-diphosphate reductase subunit alpha [bacterium BMS3Bbin13]HDJ86924.1 NrdJb [Chromatiales bacterium]HDO34171.1 NrdJb [Chromatiales bacterium]